jgi:hypothetical protein
VEQARKRALDDRVATLLATDPELRSRLPRIEAALEDCFGPGAKVTRGIVNEIHDDQDDSDELHLRVEADLSVDASVERLSEFHEREGELLDPVRARLSIGFL